MRWPVVSLLYGLLAGPLLACGSLGSNAPANGGAPDSGSVITQDASGPDASPGQDATVTPDGGSTTPLPCGVAAIMEGSCQSCHGAVTTAGAPMSLVTWQDLHAASASSKSTPVYQLVESRIHDAKNPMPPAPNPRLGAADLATIDAWVDAGAPPGAGTCGGDASGPIPDANPPPLECTTDDLTIGPGTPWSMPQTDDDDYVCFGYDAPAGSIPAGTTRHVLGMTPHVDNHAIVHHVILYQADQSYSSTPTLCNPGGGLGWRVVYGWAPGGGAMQTPTDVGFPYDGTTHWVVQVHYNNVKHLASQTDTTGFSLCTTGAAVKYDADVIAFGTTNISIPPLATLDQTCTWPIPASLDGAHLFAAFPHMHQLGVGIETEQLMTAGGIVDLGRNDPWNFNQQSWFPISATLAAGDVVSTRCAWQNSTSASVGWGPTTEDEMCYSFTAYYPAVPTLSWTTPSGAATCGTTPAGGLPTPDAGWVIPDGGPPRDAAGD